MPSLQNAVNDLESQKMKDLHSVEEVIVTAYDNLDGMPRKDISAVWARVPQLMSKRQPRHHSNSSKKLPKEDMRQMMYKIFDNTVTAIEDCTRRRRRRNLCLILTT